MANRLYSFFRIVFVILFIPVALGWAEPQLTTPTSLSSPAETSLNFISITLKPQLEVSPLPAWMTSPVKVVSDRSLIEIPLPALSQTTSIENFVLTIAFNDQGDGGPLVEWIKSDGTHTMICSGLGVNGPAVGLNARTLLIPYDLAFEGGVISITHAGRFNQIISVTIRPGHTTMVSALGENNDPAIIDEASIVTSTTLAAGELPPLKQGDATHGRIVSAELAAKTEQLPNGTIEFIFSLNESLPEAAMLNTEIISLDLESQIEVQVNDLFIGILNTAPFSLAAPELINSAAINSHKEDLPSFQLAGWRKAWLYIPARVWHQGENHLVLTVHSGTAPTASPSLRNTTLDLLNTTATLRNTTTPLAKDFFRF